MTAIQMNAEEDPTLMTKEEFFARVDKAEKEIAEGKGKTLLSFLLSIRASIQEPLGFLNPGSRKRCGSS